MIARIGHFDPMTPEQMAAAEFNLRERFKPALTAQEGLVAAYWLKQPDGHWLSFTIWESVEHLIQGGTRANATPLLPGQDGSLIPGPVSHEIWEVVDRS
jgi:hypothetical protein